MTVFEAAFRLRFGIGEGPLVVHPCLHRGQVSVHPVNLAFGAGGCLGRHTVSNSSNVIEVSGEIPEQKCVALRLGRLLDG